MKGFYYLGSPYSNQPAGLDAAHKAVCVEAGRLISRGLAVYSPIAHMHPIARYGLIDPHAHDIWIPIDEPLMAAAKGLIVLTLDGWSQSVGLGYEISFFEEKGLPVVYMTPGTVPEGLT